MEVVFEGSAYFQEAFSDVSKSFQCVSAVFYGFQVVLVDFLRSSSSKGFSEVSKHFMASRNFSGVGKWFSDASGCFQEDYRVTSNRSKFFQNFSGGSRRFYVGFPREFQGIFR